MRMRWTLFLAVTAAGLLWVRTSAASTTPDGSPPPELLKNLELLKEWDTARNDGLWADFEVVSATGPVVSEGGKEK